MRTVQSHKVYLGEVEPNHDRIFEPSRLTQILWLAKLDPSRPSHYELIGSIMRNQCKHYQFVLPVLYLSFSPKTSSVAIKHEPRFSKLNRPPHMEFSLKPTSSYLTIRLSLCYIARCGYCAPADFI